MYTCNYAGTNEFLSGMKMLDFYRYCIFQLFIRHSYFSGGVIDKKLRKIINVKKNFLVEKSLLKILVARSFLAAPLCAPEFFTWAVPLLSFRGGKKRRKVKAVVLRIHLPLRIVIF